MSPHEKVKLMDNLDGMYVQHSLFLSSCIKFGEPKYIAPYPLIAHLVNTEDRLHANQIRLYLFYFQIAQHTYDFFLGTRRIEAMRTKLRYMSFFPSDRLRDPVEPMQYMEHHLFLLMLTLWYM